MLYSLDNCPPEVICRYSLARDEQRQRRRMQPVLTSNSTDSMLSVSDCMSMLGALRKWLSRYLKEPAARWKSSFAAKTPALVVRSYGWQKTTNKGGRYFVLKICHINTETKTWVSYSNSHQNRVAYGNSHQDRITYSNSHQDSHLQ